MDQERDFKGVWIPKEIYLDINLNWTEKIMLIEIDSLDGENGCFASNEHFAKHLMISKDRAGKIINKLVIQGYVTREIIYKKGTKQIEKRILHSTIGYSQKQLGAIVENTYRGIVKNDQDNNTIINNTINNTINIKKERKKKTTTYDETVMAYTDNLELRDCIFEFIKMRKLIKKPMTDRGLKLMLNKLDKISYGSLENKIEILNNSIMNNWQGIYELKIDTPKNSNNCTSKAMNNLQKMYKEAQYEENGTNPDINDPF